MAFGGSRGPRTSAFARGKVEPTVHSVHGEPHGCLAHHISGLRVYQRKPRVGQVCAAPSSGPRQGSCRPLIGHAAGRQRRGTRRHFWQDVGVRSSDIGDREPVTTTVTVLFCDLVASTERGQLLGDDDADQFRRAFFSRMDEAVATTHGSVVKNTGDGLIVVFRESAVSAVTCAATMHDKIEALDVDPPAFLRVGISAGEVSPEEGDYWGMPVVESARLCSAAEPGQTLVSDVVRVLVGTRGGHQFRSVGALTLKGLAARRSSPPRSFALLSRHLNPRPRGGRAAAHPGATSRSRSPSCWSPRWSVWSSHWVVIRRRRQTCFLPQPGTRRAPNLRAVSNSSARFPAT